MERTVKARMIRAMVYFLGTVLGCTIISRSIYDYLLPVVSTTTVASGAVSVTQYVTGKIGLDESEVKHNQVVVISPIAGNIVDFAKVEGDYIEQGEVIGTVREKVDQTQQQKKAKEEEVERIQLTQEMEQSARAKQQKQDQIKTLQEECKEKQKTLLQIEEDYQIVNLKEEIKAQEKLVENNKALYEVGALPEKEQKDAQSKLEQLNRSLEETKKNLKSTLEESIKGYKNQIDTLEEEITQLNEKYALDSKKIEPVATQQEKEEVITSPISGYIQTVNVANKAYVDANTKLMVIIPDGLSYHLSFELTDEGASKVVVGQKVSFNWTQMPYEAQVIKKDFNEQTGNVVISCEIEKQILDKMNLDYTTYRTVNVEVAHQSEEYPQVINNSAIQSEYSNHYVYWIEEKEQLGRSTYILHKVLVNILEEGDFKSSISGTLDSKMKFVDGNLSGLEDGQEVALQ